MAGYDKSLANTALVPNYLSTISISCEAIIWHALIWSKVIPLACLLRISYAIGYENDRAKYFHFHYANLNVDTCRVGGAL